MERELKHKRSDTWGHRKRLFNILQTEWISMRFSAGSYNIQVKGIRSCRQLKVVPKKYSLLSVRWILILENRGERSLDHNASSLGVLQYSYHNEIKDTISRFESAFLSIFGCLERSDIANMIPYRKKIVNTWIVVQTNQLRFIMRNTWNQINLSKKVITVSIKIKWSTWNIFYTN